MDSTNDSFVDFREVCRTCLSKDIPLTSIFDSKAAEMLNYCNFSAVSRNDELPEQICFICVQNLEQSYNFKKQCENSYAALKKLALKYSTSQEDNSLDSSNGRDVLMMKNEDVITVFSEREFDCKECNIVFADLQTLHQHKTTHKLLKCNKCAKLFLSEVELNEHLESNHLENKNDTFDKVSEDLISFLEKPLPPPLQYVCQHCSESFSEENDLKIHQSVHNDELICLSCFKKFTARKILKRHLKIHLIKKPHVCHICNKSFPESYALTKHLRRHSGIPREKKHLCPECGQRFSEPFYLNVHIRKHTGERPLICSVCEKSFADPRSLKIHKMIHTGERPHKCRFCHKSFIQNTNLIKHERIHTGEKPYVCKQCGKGFSQSSSLDKHHRTHTGEKLFSCKICCKRFSEKSTLKNHIKIHSEGKHLCTQCLCLFKDNSELLLHFEESCGKCDKETKLFQKDSLKKYLKVDNFIKETQLESTNCDGDLYSETTFL